MEPFYPSWEFDLHFVSHFVILRWPVKCGMKVLRPPNARGYKENGIDVALLLSTI